jgi:hypothetical protein
MTTEIQKTPCDHHDEPHTVWWMEDDGGPPVPMERVFDDQADALQFAGFLKRDGKPEGPPKTLLWVKVFRSDNESYTCYQWSAPKPAFEPDETVRIEQLPPRPARDFSSVLVGIAKMLGQLVGVVFLIALAIIVVALLGSAVVLVLGWCFDG